MNTLAKLIIIIVSFILLYLGYSVLQDNSMKLAKEQRAIDSLNIEIVKLDSQHVKKDSVITVYKDSIVYIDKEIQTQKTKYIHIKHKYNEIRNHVISYTPTQLDSFFSERYKHLESDTVSQSR